MNSTSECPTCLQYERDPQCADPWHDDWPKRWSWRLIFEPRDLWVGLYWDRPNSAVTDLYFCLLPMLVLHIRRAVIPRVIPFHHDGGDE